MADKGRKRVNLTVSVPPDVKARTVACAKHENNSTSRIVENALLAYLGAWGTDEDLGPDADKHRELVRSHLL